MKKCTCTEMYFTRRSIVEMIENCVQRARNSLEVFIGVFKYAFVATCDKFVLLNDFPEAGRYTGSGEVVCFHVAIGSALHEHFE